MCFKETLSKSSIKHSLYYHGLLKVKIRQIARMNDFYLVSHIDFGHIFLIDGTPIQSDTTKKFKLKKLMFLNDK